MAVELSLSTPTPPLSVIDTYLDFLKSNHFDPTNELYVELEKIINNKNYVNISHEIETQIIPKYVNSPNSNSETFYIIATYYCKVIQNYEFSVNFYKKAIFDNDGNHVYAKLKLADYYYFEETNSINNIVSSFNMDLAFGLYQDCADNHNNSGAQNVMGRFMCGSIEYLPPEKIDFKLATNYFMKSAEQNNIYAYFNLGFLHLGHYGGDEYDIVNLTKSFHYFLKGAEQGDDDCQYQVSLFYEQFSETYQNSTIELDYEQSYRWRLKSAEKGNRLAQYLLSFNQYRLGHGIEINYEKSKYWLLKAAGNNCYLAMSSLYKYYRDGDKKCGIEKDLCLYGEWLMKCIEKSKCEDAMYELGTNYILERHGYARDFTLGICWLLDSWRISRKQSLKTEIENYIYERIVYLGLEVDTITINNKLHSLGTDWKNIT